MKWRESLIVVALVIASVVLITWRGSDEPDGASQVTTAEPQQPPDRSFIVQRALDEPSPGLAVPVDTNPEPENPDLPFTPPEGIILPPMSGTPTDTQEMIRSRPELARALEEQLSRSHESYMVGVRMALDALELDQATYDNILEEIDLSHPVLLAAQMAEASGEITYEEYWEVLAEHSVSDVVARYLTTPQMIEFDELMIADYPRQRADARAEMEKRVAEAYERLGITPQN